MRPNKSNLVAAIVIIIMFAALIILVWDYPRAANRLLLIIGVVGIMLASVLVVREIASRGKRDSLGEVKENRYSVPGKKLLVTSAWIVSLLPLVYLTGFTVGASLYSFTYYKLHGGRWLPSIVLGLAIAGLVYFVFIVGMQVRFPRPILLPFYRW